MRYNRLTTVRYAFADFELDTEAQELIRAGERVKVQPKVLQLLCYLVEHRGRAVSKEELLAALWPRGTVTESALFVCVRGARAALGQPHAADQPIATLRGAGYRFDLEVRELNAGSTPAGVPARRSSRPPAAPRVTSEFVGREHVMLALAGALAGAGTGQGQFVLLVGEPGIGKTHCIDALTELALRNRAQVLRARCVDAEGAPAFWPWIQLLRQLAAAEGPSAPEARVLLERLVSSANQPGPSGSSGAEPWPSDRFWLSDGVIRVLHGAAAVQPCVLSIDDLQWADEASLQLLHTVVSEIERMRCVIAATAREPPNAGETRERWLRRLSRAAKIIELTGLSEAEVVRLVGALPDPSNAAALAKTLHERTAGNPFFLREMLRLALSGEQGEHALLSGQLPLVVRDVIRGRLDGLDASAQTVLRAASVLGREFDVAVLRKLLDRPEDVSGALEAAVAARLVVHTASAERFAFQHDLVRETLYAELGHVERVRYHLRAGEALEALAESGAGQAFHAELAHHFQLALSAGVHEKALRHAVAAAVAARRVLAFDSAVRCYRWALAALDYYPRDRPRMRAELMIELAVAVLSAGRSTEAREIVRSAVDIAERHGYGDLLAAAGTWLRHNVATAPMPDPLALRALESAFAWLGEDQPKLRADVLARLAWIWPNCEDMTKCKALARDALALARRLDSTATLLGALAATLYAHTGPDDFAELMATADEILAVERATQTLTWSSAQAHFVRYHALLRRADRAAADEALDAFGAVVRKLRLAEPTLLHDRMCSQRAFYEGRFAEAEAQFAEQHARGRRLGLDYADLYYGLQLVALHWEREGVNRMALPKPKDEAWNLFHTVAFRASRLFMQCEAGRPADAASEFQRLAADGFAAVPRDFNYLHTLVYLANVAVALNDAPQARVLYERLAPYARCNTPSLLSQVLGAVAHHLGLLARLLGERSQAAAQFETALSLHEHLGYVPWNARTQVAYAALLLDGGDARERARARELLHAANATATKLGLGPVARAVRELRARAQ